MNSRTRSISQSHQRTCNNLRMTFGEAVARGPRWIAQGDPVCRNVLGDDGSRSNDGAVANRYARRNNGARADPDIIPDDDTSFRAWVSDNFRGFRPVCYCWERVGNPVHAVVTT